MSDAIMLGPDGRPLETQPAPPLPASVRSLLRASALFLDDLEFEDPTLQTQRQQLVTALLTAAGIDLGDGDPT